MKTLLIIFFLIFLTAAVAEDQVKSIPLPGGSSGIGFDDLHYSAHLNRALIPAGKTGALDLIDPETLEVTQISGFSTNEKDSSGRWEGITSVDEANGLLLVTDRSSLKLLIVDSETRKIIGSAELASSPDYVRFVSPTHEIWVTEPDSDRIEIFSFSEKPAGATHSGFLAVEGGPEALVIDGTRGRAYTHLWKGKTVAIDIKNRKILSTWDNGCEGSRGIDLDEKSGILFIGCSEGKAVAMDLNGKIISTVTSGVGVDIIDYNPVTRHLYFPGGKSATMAIIDVSSDHQLKVLGTVPTAEGSHCVTSDNSGNTYICDPHHGSILVIRDSYK